MQTVPPAGPALPDPPHIVAFVLAGGEGRRLRPLTDACPKPALPLAGQRRLLDFALSNLHNAGIGTVFVLLPRPSRLLAAHLAQAWAFAAGRPSSFIEPVAAVRPGEGTADTLRRHLGLLDGCRAELAAVVNADHVGRIDLRAMARAHALHAADASIAVRTAGEQRPGRPLGVQLFRPEALRDALRTAALLEQHDLAHDVLPRMAHEASVHRWDYGSHDIPGLQACEQPHYWRTIDTLPAYLAAQRDLTGSRPPIVLDSPAWPIHGAAAMG